MTSQGVIVVNSMHQRLFVMSGDEDGGVSIPVLLIRKKEGEQLLRGLTAVNARIATIDSNRDQDCAEGSVPKHPIATLYKGTHNTLIAPDLKSANGGQVQPVNRHDDVSGSGGGGADSSAATAPDLTLSTTRENRDRLYSQLRESSSTMANDSSVTGVSMSQHIALATGMAGEIIVSAGAEAGVADRRLCFARAEHMRLKEGTAVVLEGLLKAPVCALFVTCSAS